MCEVQNIQFHTLFYVCIRESELNDVLCDTAKYCNYAEY